MKIETSGRQIVGLGKHIPVTDPCWVSTDTYLLKRNTIRALLQLWSDEKYHSSWSEIVIDQARREYGLSFEVLAKQSISKWFEVDTKADLIQAHSLFSRSHQIFDIQPGKSRFVFDLDGTLIDENGALPDAVECVSVAQNAGVRVTIVTNNTSKSKDEIRTELVSLGFSEYIEVYSPLDAVLSFMRSQNVKKFSGILSPKALNFLSNAGAVFDHDEPELIVIGLSSSYCYEDLEKICAQISSGTPYIQTHADTSYPSSKGPIPDAGAVSALIQATTGVKPYLMFGKPDTNILGDTLNENNGQVQFVCGDTLTTDVQLGKNLGAKTILITKEGALEDLQALSTDGWPDVLCLSMKELLYSMKQSSSTKS